MSKFGWLPGHWGLKGKSRERAKAEYELKGYDLEVRMAEIDNDDPSALARRLDEINLKHKKMSQKDYDIAMANRTLGGLALEGRLLEIEFNEGNMTEHEFNKRLASIKKEPYVAVINSDYDPAKVLDGIEFEFDWNDEWIQLLTSHGYTGLNEEMIVQSWFEDICRGVLSDVAAKEPMPFNSRRVNQTPSNNGLTDYS